MYNLEIDEGVYKIFKKLEKKDPKQLKAVSKKIKQIRTNPDQFKPLKAPMQRLRRVHIGSFVLVYEIDKNRKTVIIWSYKHHDKAYKKVRFGKIIRYEDIKEVLKDNYS